MARKQLSELAVNHCPLITISLGNSVRYICVLLQILLLSSLTPTTNVAPISTQEKTNSVLLSVHCPLKSYYVRKTMYMRQLGRETIPARTRDGQSQSGPRIHWCAQNLKLGGDRIEEFGEFLCHVAVPTGKQPRQAAAQTRPGNSTCWHTCGSGLG